MAWPRYPAYRDSGVEWLGEVPAGWQIRKLRYIAAVNFSTVDKKSEDNEESVRLCNYVDVYYNDTIVAGLNFMEATATPSEIRRFTLKAGDVLVTKDSEDWEDIAVPAYVPNDVDGVLCGYHLAQIRSDADIINGDYIFRCFLSYSVNHQFRTAAHGIMRYGIGKDAFNDSLFPIPPRSEQYAIATFLDRETARIDAMIAKKERQIALLQEKRAALIGRAVTKGLDSSVPMTDSGIAWLGEVPVVWQLSQLKHVSSMKSGEGITLEMLEEEGEIPVFGGNGLRGYTTRFTHNGDYVLIGRQGALCGNIHRVNGRFWASEHAIVVSPRAGISVQWLAYVLSAMDLNQYSFTAAQPGLAVDFIKTIRIAVPTLLDQQAIVAFLDRQIALINSLIAKNEQVITLLQEYRRALISTSVTGKIDVRGEAPA